MIQKCAECNFLLAVEKTNFHPGGTALRGEAMVPSDRCALKPKKDNCGRLHDPLRWVMSGGSPVTVAHPCSGVCPLNVRAEVYGRIFVGSCPVCKRASFRNDLGKRACIDCGTEFILVEEVKGGVNATKTDDFVVRYGEQYRALITDALEFLNVHEPGWRLETPVDREKYIKEIIRKLKGNKGKKSHD